MDLTKRMEKQLTKVFDDPKKLRKWIDKVYQEMLLRCKQKTENMINEYLDIYSIAVAYTLRYVCGFGKKRLPEVMNRIWNNVDSFRDGYISIEDCVQDLKENGIEFDTIVNEVNKVHWEGDEKNANK